MLRGSDLAPLSIPANEKGRTLVGHYTAVTKGLVRQVEGLVGKFPPKHFVW